MSDQPQPRRVPDEMALINTRTDADSAADRALDDLLTHCRIESARTQCYIRDALAEAFRAGEHQGQRRAVFILAIARTNTQSAAVNAALAEVAQLLLNEAPEETR
jgi:hypothetical protein